MCSHHPTNLCLQQFVGYPRSGYGEYRVRYSPPIHDWGRLAVDFHWGFTSESGPQQWTHHEFWNVWNFLDHDVNLTVRAWLTAYGHSTWDFTSHFGKVQQRGDPKKLSSSWYWKNRRLVFDTSIHHFFDGLPWSSRHPTHQKGNDDAWGASGGVRPQRPCQTSSWTRGLVAFASMMDRLNIGAGGWRQMKLEYPQVPRLPERRHAGHDCLSTKLCEETDWLVEQVWTTSSFGDVQTFWKNCWAETPTRSLSGDLSDWVVQIAGICWPLLSYSLAIWILRLFQPGSRWWRVKKRVKKTDTPRFGMPYHPSAWIHHHPSSIIWARHLPQAVKLANASTLARRTLVDSIIRRNPNKKATLDPDPGSPSHGRGEKYHLEKGARPENSMYIIRLNWDEVRKFDMCMYIW